MFFHNFKYALKSLLKTKETIFWTLIFPIALGTFMYMAFGNLMDQEEMFHSVPVAVVSGKENSELETVLLALSEGEDPMLKVSFMEESDALKALEEEQVEGVIYTSDTSLLVNESNLNASMLETVLEQYKQIEYVCADIGTNNPGILPEVVMQLMGDQEYFIETTTSDGCQNEYYNYFYAIFAMSCLFASFSAISRINKLQANVSALGMRRCLSPNGKIVSVTAEYLALLIVHFIIELIVLAYLMLLGVDFGGHYPAIALILLLGCSIGLSIGVIIASIYKLSEGAKMGIAVSIGMLLSVMADLCAAGIKDFIEHHVPVLNRINPAVVISDSFYALNVYDDYSRYTGNMLILSVMAVLLLGISIMILGRNKYASL